MLSFLNPKQVAFRYKITKKMNKIQKKLIEIAEERIKFHLIPTIREKRNGVLDWRQTTSIISQPQVYGRDEDKGKVVDFLVGDASGIDDLSVYPIVGLGGLGKTTLAQVIFNHDSVVKHFELRMWVCVSEDFSLKRMTKAILESASGNASEDLDLELLQKQLQDLLQGKRYLLVLDDVWDYEQENWQRLRSVLACGGKGASTLVTTRITKVAEIMGTMPPYELSKLSDIDCWKLFKQRAFGSNEVEQEELVVIGKEILKKCVGVPLAAKALGSLLRFKREENEWLYVKESKLWNLQDEDSVMPALRLSYLNLPVKLRQCFSYCALFPKDEKISKKLLIDLWMANGVISSNEVLEVEDVGNEVCNELYWRSFFQDIEKDAFGKIENFKMHDLVHDLAQSITEEVCCIAEPRSCERIRHLSIYGRQIVTDADAIQLHGIKSLRTFLKSSFEFTPPYVLKCYSLRVLDLQQVKKVPSSVCRLKYLRYLNLSSGRFKSLPKSISKLSNLVILNLDYCNNLQKLPNSLVHLKTLQHLSLNYCNSLLSLPPHIRMLNSLKTLTLYVVGKKNGLHLGELRQLNLKGDLYIKHLERVKSVMSAKEANMSNKYVSNLQLSWERNEESQLQENVEEILEVLQPQPQQLQCLAVVGYTGVYFPQWISSPSLKYLTCLQFVDCQRCLDVPHLGKLPSLKKLTISKMSRVKYLYEESSSSNGAVAGGFTTLELLILEKLPNLVRLSREDRDDIFPCLSKLQITDCPILLSFPCLPSLGELIVRGKCNQDLLSSIHKLSSLESLQFKDNEDLTCFPDGMLRNLTSLKSFGISNLSKLDKFPTEISNNNAIREICVGSCGNLKSLTDEVLQRLHSLKILRIVICQKFNLTESFKYLTCLEKLIIQSCSEIEGLHEGLQHMTALKSLVLSDLPNLASLPDWLGNLGLLHDIEIILCPKLMCLPMSIERLKCLKRLSIHSCSELKKRCRENTGEDWQKVAHIQCIVADNSIKTYGGEGHSYGICLL